MKNTTHSLVDQLTKGQLFLLQLVIACNSHGVEPLRSVLIQVMAQGEGEMRLVSSQVIAAVTFLRQARCLELDHDKPLKATELSREVVRHLPVPNGLSEVVNEVTRTQRAHARLTQRGG